jgi:hypothetical protein
MVIRTKLQQELLKQLILFYNKKNTIKKVSLLAMTLFFYAIKCMILSPKHLKFNYQKVSLYR